MNFIISFLFIFLIQISGFCTMAHPANGAEDLSEAEGEERWELLWRRIQTERLIQIQEALGLSKDQASRLIPKLKSLDEEKRAIGKQKLFLMRGLKEKIKTPGTTKDTDWFLRRLEENQDALNKVGEETQRILKETLTPAQQAQYLIFQQKFKKELRDRILKERGKDKP